MRGKYVAFVECNASGTGVEAMRRVRERGLSVILLTREREFYGTLESNPLEHADIVIDVCTTCVGSMLNRLCDYSLCGVLAFDDYRLITAAVLARHFGLPAPDIEGLLNCRFKNRTRRAVRSGGVDSRVFNLLQPMDTRSLPYPCVIKPCDDSGSAGVRICRGPAEFEDAVDYLRRHRIDARGYRLSGEFLAEEFVEGDEFSAELVWSCERSDWDLLGMTRKTITSGTYAVETGHDFPARPAGHDAIAMQIRGWLAEAKLSGTVAHVEFKRKEGESGARLIEINPRPGGDMIHLLCKTVTGIDLVEAYLSLLIAEEFPAPPAGLASAAAASIRFLLPPSPGEVIEVRAPPFENPSILSSKFKKGPFLVENIGSSHARLGFVMAAGDNIKDAARLADEAIARTRVKMAPAP